MLNRVIDKSFKYLKYFHKHLGHRILVAIVLSSIVGLLDGLGLAMFLPLLQLADGDATVDSDGMGNLSFLTDGISALGIDLTIFSVLVVILVFFALKGLVRFGSSYYRVKIKFFFVSRLRFNCIDLLSKYEYKSFVTSDSGLIQNTLSGEVGRVVEAFMAYFGTIQNLVLVMVYVGLAFLANPQFAILVAVGGVITNLVFRGIYSKTKDFSSRITTQNHHFQGLLIQQVGFFKYLKAAGGIMPYALRLKKSVVDIEESNKVVGVLGAFLEALREPLIVIVVVAVIIVQMFFFEQSIALIILSLLFFYRSMTYLMLVQVQWNTFLSASGAVDNMERFVEELSAHQQADGNLTIDKVTSDIQFNSVNFSYGKTKVINDLELTIARNETIAFVGESGSGKSTIINLLSGLLVPDTGSVLINGLDLRQLQVASFQRRIGYITQEPVIFSDNVFNNVTFWAEPTPQNIERFNDALKKAAIYDYVQELSDKELTLLGTNGITMSGGQKQRISIARELYKDIDILIMDEATSALDSETEKVIQENIDRMKGKYTIIIVAHRLSTIKNADKIVILKEGCIEKVGSFDALLNESKVFKRMVELQEI
jgi:ABC-type multidrug transport system fused ATPase/permease subunit